MLHTIPNFSPEKKAKKHPPKKQPKVIICKYNKLYSSGKKTNDLWHFTSIFWISLCDCLPLASHHLFGVLHFRLLLMCEHSGYCC